MKTNDIDFAAIDKELICGHFHNVNELKEGGAVPDAPGLYCIKLRDGATLPEKYGRIREDRIIYIGQASGSLRKRLWEEELNHKRAATFFRSIGAVLGYLPPKGSLVNKRNKKNYRFNDNDTEEIIDWMRKSLSVNFMKIPASQLKEVEERLIVKYEPLINIKNNPSASQALKDARKKCTDYANALG